MEDQYSRTGLQTALKVVMLFFFCLPYPVAVICTGLCACAERLWMCVLYVSLD